MIFRDRTDAGRRLALSLSHLRGQPGLLVLALPRGGIPVAAEVARALAAPLDLCFARKIGAPNDPEFAIGAVAETGAPFLEEALIQSLRVPYAYLREEAAAQQEDIARRARHYRGARPAPEIEGRCVILIDDGVATGATAHAALQTLRLHKPARLIFAAPIAAADAVRRLAVAADEIVVLQAPVSFFAVGEFYDRFFPVPDEEVIACLNNSPSA